MANTGYKDYNQHQTLTYLFRVTQRSTYLKDIPVQYIAHSSLYLILHTYVRCQMIYSVLKRNQIFLPFVEIVFF